MRGFNWIKSTELLYSDSQEFQTNWTIPKWHQPTLKSLTSAVTKASLSYANLDAGSLPVYKPPRSTADQGGRFGPKALDAERKILSSVTQSAKTVTCGHNWSLIQWNSLIWSKIDNKMGGKKFWSQNSNKNYNNLDQKWFKFIKSAWNKNSGKKDLWKFHLTKTTKCQLRTSKLAKNSSRRPKRP